MSSTGSTLGNEFRCLREQFEEESSRYPGLHHCWIWSACSIRPGTLEKVLPEIVALPVVGITDWPDRDQGIVHYNCFLGESALTERFRPLAERARLALVSLLKATKHNVLHHRLGPVEAWLADVCHVYRENPSSEVSVRQETVYQWHRTGAAPFRIVVPRNDEEARVPTSMLDFWGYRESIRLREFVKYKPPSLHFWIDRLNYNVFRASSLFIRDILDPTTTSTENAKALSITMPPIGGEAHPSGGKTRSKRPEWYSDAEAIGPCTSVRFAELLGVAKSTLQRRIARGTVWKEPGPGPKQFYFQHKSKAQQDQLKMRYASGEVRALKKK